MNYYEKDENIVSRKIADELILVPIKQKVGDIQSMYTVNEVGSRIWELIDGGTSVEAIASVLTQEYEVEATQAEADTREFLEQLMQIGAVTFTAIRNQEGS